MRNLLRAKRAKGPKGKRAVKFSPLSPFCPFRPFASLQIPWASLPRTPALLALTAALALLALLAFPAAAAPPREQVLEDLQFRVDAWVLTDAARGRVIFKNLGGGRYRAEVAAEAQGLAKLLSGQRRDNYSTEMAYRDGRLLPLVYREETRRRGKYGLKEYRFNYDQGRLELWQHHKGKGLLRKWDTALTKETIYDPLSAFYNLRLGVIRRPQEGETLRVMGIPYPHPEEIVIRMGPQGPEGRKVMVSLINRAFEDEQGVIFVFFDEHWAPTQAWTRILRFGKVAGEILPESKPLRCPLPEMLSVLKSSRFKVPGSK